MLPVLVLEPNSAACFGPTHPVKVWRTKLVDPPFL